jgi:alpha-D-xyloside xylohydrolase
MSDAPPNQSVRRYSKEYPNGQLILNVYSADIVRCRFVPKRDTDFLQVQIVQMEPRTQARFEIRQEDGYVELNTSRLLLRVYDDGPRVDLFDPDGRPLSLDASGVTDSGESLQATRRIGEDEEFFGFGLQFHSFSQRGKTKFLKINADPKDDSGNSHAVAPLMLSTAGYGVFLDSHSYVRFDLGATHPDRLTFETPDPVLDYYFFYGPSFNELLSHYTELTGRISQPPKWGLGFWYRMKSEWKAEEVKAVAAGFRERNIPCDVIGLEPKWQTHAYPCSYVWNPETFPDPKGFVAWMRENRFHVNLWEHAYVHESSPIYEKLKNAGVVADHTVWGGLVPDFTMPETLEIFESFHLKEHVDLGADGYKLDECDGSDYTGGWFFPDDTKFPSGLSGAQMHNIFGLLYQEAFHAMFARRNRRSYFLCRALFAGGQAYPTVIYSDWYGFREYVRVAANSGFSGILWCPEIRQTDDPGEFVRRFQTVFFSPLAMINAWADGVTPWEKGPEIEAIFRVYADLRMRLMPYLYTAFWRMSRNGKPVVRGLVNDYPQDRETYAVDDQFLYGESFMAAPVFSGESRSVYLPEGKWIDWWTEETYSGPARILYAAPLERLPLFVKSGALIPMGPSMNYVGEKPTETLTIRVYPGDSASEFMVYDDDGETLAHYEGAQCRLKLECRPEEKRLSLQHGDIRGNYKPEWIYLLWEAHGVESEPRRVMFGTSRLARLSREDLETAETGYAYDADARIAWAKVPISQPGKVRMER